MPARRFGLFSRSDKARREVDDELQFHLEMRARKLEREGLSADVASGEVVASVTRVYVALNPRIRAVAASTRPRALRSCVSIPISG